MYGKSKGLCTWQLVRKHLVPWHLKSTRNWSYLKQSQHRCQLALQAVLPQQFHRLHTARSCFCRFRRQIISHSEGTLPKFLPCNFRISVLRWHAQFTDAHHHEETQRATPTNHRQ